jgi:MoaA/NifB/PqqE/SkfB family radical SAM enzyme
MKNEFNFLILLYTIWLEMKRGISGKKYIAEIDVTDNCNLRCKHCYHFYGKKEFNRNEIHIGEWKKRFNELYDSGIRFVLLVGGEPALRNDVLMLAQSIFSYVAVITNGTIKIPKEFNNRLFVSIDGRERTNDAIRGKGVFSRIIKNYSGDSRVIINMTVMEENYKELENVIKVAKKHGFDGVVCNIYTPGIEYKGPMFIKNKGRGSIIRELKRVKSLYPNDFLLSKSMIKWYEYPDHRNHCYWGDNSLHFDVLWEKRRCFAKADCSNCGCLAGTLQNPLKMIFSLREAYKII